MRSAQDDSFDTRVAELERFLDELDRKTYSNFAVTNPVSGVKNLEVGPSGGGYAVALRDSNGNLIFGNRPDVGISGFRVPMPMYPATPYSSRHFATNTTWVDMWQMRTFVNARNLQVQYRYGDFLPSGGTSEARVQYDLGAGRVTMTGSGTTAVNPTNTVYSFSFPWPSDVFDTEVTVVIQGRMASGTGNLMVSPIYMLGG